MTLKEYLEKHKIKKKDFAKKLGIARVTLNVYILYPKRIPYPTRLALEYLTCGEIRREDFAEA